VDEAQRARAEARRDWPGTVTTLEAQDGAAIVREGTPVERMAMVWRVTRDTWILAGRSFPRYTRATMPGRVIRNHD
jgi:hypothetical protein